MLKILLSIVGVLAALICVGSVRLWIEDYAYTISYYASYIRHHVLPWQVVLVLVVLMIIACYIYHRKSRKNG